MSRSADELKARQRQKSTDRKKHMPLLNVKMIEGVFTPKQKQEMIRKLTDTMVSIEGENLRPYTLVVLEEVKSGDWGVGGNSLTDSDVKALAAGSSKS
jgi:4-oxalocrotonate tautomerase